MFGQDSLTDHLFVKNRPKFVSLLDRHSFHFGKKQPKRCNRPCSSPNPRLQKDTTHNSYFYYRLSTKADIVCMLKNTKKIRK